VTASAPCRNVRAVFFDAVGTIVQPGPPAPEVYARFGRCHGSALSLEDIRGRFARAFRRQEEYDRTQAWRTSEEREVQRWRTIVAEVLDDVSDPSACFQDLFDHFARPDAWRCTDDAATILQTLAATGCVLGLASNFDRRLRTIVAGLPALAAISRLVISSEVGWRKPSPHFFAEVCRAADSSPSEILLVGDDLANDYASAKEFGMSALLYDPEGQSDPEKVRRIRRLGELLELPRLLD
jgi:putative hydrolase of the HAD superfamily